MTADPQQGAHAGLIWHAGRSSSKQVNPGRPLDAYAFADRLRRHPSMVGAVVEVLREDCVRALMPGQEKPRLYHGVHPFVAGDVSEPDARRALIRLRAKWQRTVDSLTEQVDASSDLREQNLLRMQRQGFRECLADLDAEMAALAAQ